MVANDYCVVADLKEQLDPSGQQYSTTDYDAAFGNVITRASRAIDRFTGRDPGAYAVSTDQTRYYDGSGTHELMIDELAALPTSVAVAETGDVDGSTDGGGNYTTWSSSDYLPYPYNALDHSEPFTELHVDTINGSRLAWYGFPKGVKVVGKFGYATTDNTPDDIVEATIIQAVRYFKRAEQGFKDVGAIEQLSQLRYVRRLDPDVESIVAHMKRLAV